VLLFSQPSSTLTTFRSSKEEMPRANIQKIVTIPHFPSFPFCFPFPPPKTCGEVLSFFTFDVPSPFSFVQDRCMLMQFSHFHLFSLFSLVLPPPFLSFFLSLTRDGRNEGCWALSPWVALTLRCFLPLSRWMERFLCNLACTCLHISLFFLLLSLSSPA